VSFTALAIGASTDQDRLQHFITAAYEQTVQVTVELMDIKRQLQAVERQLAQVTKERDALKAAAENSAEPASAK